MTRVCLVGDDDVNLRFELLSRETSRQALATYDLAEPFANAVGLETVSLGAAVALLNDLDWYLVRFVAEAMVLEPSVSDDEWLSRDLATAVRDDEVGPAESERFLKIYGLQSASDGEPASPDRSSGDPVAEPPRRGDRNDGETPAAGDSHDEDSSEDERDGPDASTDGTRLVEPMYVTRTGDDVPDYDLRAVEGTLVERVTETEFGA